MRFMLAIALGACLLVAPAYAGGDGPLLGKELPELKLAHTLQGPAWAPEDLRGSIVLLDVFQLG